MGRRKRLRGLGHWKEVQVIKNGFQSQETRKKGREVKGKNRARSGEMLLGESS